MKEQIKILILILIIAFFVRLIFSPMIGDPYDMNNLKTWCKSTITSGVMNVLDQESYPNLPFPSYLLYLFLLKPIAFFYEHYFSPSFDFNTSILNVLLKLPPICFDLLVGIFIFWVLKRKVSFKKAYLAMSFYLFNPGVIYNSSYWGQIDVIHTFFILISIFFLIKKRFFGSWIFIIIGIFLKFQAIFLVPIIFYLNFKEKKIKNALKNFFLFIFLIILILLPFYIQNKKPFLEKIATSISYYSYLSANAFNIWWPVQYIKGQIVKDTQVLFNGLSYKTLGLILFGLAYLFILYFVNKKSDPKSIFIACSFLAFAFFMLPTEMHERYLFPIFALLSMIWIQNKKLWPIYITLSLTFFLNLIYVLPLPFMGKAGQNILGDASLIIVLVNLGVFIYFIRLMIQQLRGSECKLT